MYYYAHNNMRDLNNQFVFKIKYISYFSIYSRNIWNLGLPERRNSWGNGGVILKDSRRLVSNYENKPTGLLDLENLIKVNKNNPNHINTNLSKLLSNIDLLKLAYGNIKSKPGNMTPGVDEETLDGINNEWFNKIAKDLATGSFKFKPSKKIFIPKPKGGERPLGIPSPRDKIVQEFIRIILEAIFESSFKDSSHGFRPNKSCHTAINWVRIKFGQMRWYIEGDISKCFDSLDHKLIIESLKFRIKDQVFIDLLFKALKAGYIYLNKEIPSGEKGTPQGSLISPILSNIYLHKLDEFIDTLILKFNKGIKRRANPEYTRMIRGKLNDTIKDKQKRIKIIHEKNISPLMANDENFKRLVYVRYADDFLIGIIGSKKDSLMIREEIKEFLENKLNLQLSLEKIKITNATQNQASFLGFKIHTTPLDKRPTVTIERKGIKKVVKQSTRPLITVDTKSLVSKLTQKGFCVKNGQPTRLGRLISFDEIQIIQYYSSILRGLLNYYHCASNFWNLNRIYYILYYSCVLTLANKLKLKTKRKVIKKYGKRLAIKIDGKIIIMFPLFEKPKILSLDLPSLNTIFENYTRRVFRTKTLLNKICFACNSNINIEMHHVKHLHKLGKKNKSKDFLTTQMIKMNRKQVPLCQKCHILVHKGLYNGPKLK